MQILRIRIRIPNTRSGQFGFVIFQLLVPIQASSLSIYLLSLYKLLQVYKKMLDSVECILINHTLRPCSKYF